MYKLGDLIEQEIDTLATIETWDNGKPFADSIGDITEAIACIRYYAGYADKIHGETIPTTSQKFVYTLKQPIGVCAQIIPVSTVLPSARVSSRAQSVYVNADMKLCSGITLY